MATEKLRMNAVKDLLLKQREKYFGPGAFRPEVERRAEVGIRRSLTDRRSSIIPNRTDYSRRTSLKDRRVTRYGRRKTDL